MWEPSLLTPSACVRPISDMQDYLFLFFGIIEMFKKKKRKRKWKRGAGGLGLWKVWITRREWRAYRIRDKRAERWVWKHCRERKRQRKANSGTKITPYVCISGLSRLIKRRVKLLSTPLILFNVQSVHSQLLGFQAVKLARGKKAEILVKCFIQMRQSTSYNPPALYSRPIA